MVLFISGELCGFTSAENMMDISLDHCTYSVLGVHTCEHESKFLTVWLLRYVVCGTTLGPRYRIFAGSFWPKRSGNDAVHTFEVEYSLKLG